MNNEFSTSDSSFSETREWVKSRHSIPTTRKFGCGDSKAQNESNSAKPRRATPTTGRMRNTGFAATPSTRRSQSSQNERAGPTQIDDRLATFDRAAADHRTAARRARTRRAKPVRSENGRMVPVHPLFHQA